MRFKLDENLPLEAAERLRAAGFDAVTVPEQKLSGQSDQSIASVCLAEQRVLLSLDLDFADIRMYPPQKYPGIVVLRPHCQDRDRVLGVIERLIPLLGSEPLATRLWVVDENAIRIRGGD